MSEVDFTRHFPAPSSVAPQTSCVPEAPVLDRVMPLPVTPQLVSNFSHACPRAGRARARMTRCWRRRTAAPTRALRPPPPLTLALQPPLPLRMSLPWAAVRWQHARSLSPRRTCMPPLTGARPNTKHIRLGCSPEMFLPTLRSTAHSAKCHLVQGTEALTRPHCCTNLCKPPGCQKHPVDGLIDATLGHHATALTST